MRKILIPVLLLTLPLIGIAALALRAFEADRVMVQARQAEAAVARLRLLGDSAQEDMAQAAERAVRRVRSAVVTSLNPVETLHGLISNGDFELITLHQSDQRLFPPEDTMAVLMPEAQKLYLLAGALTAARAELLAGQSATWSWIAGPLGTSLLHCRHDEEQDGEICVLLDGASLRAILRDRLDSANMSSNVATISYVEPDGSRIGTSVDPAAPSALATLTLTGPLRGWQMEAWPVAVTGFYPQRWLPYAAIGLPLLLCWLLLCWHFHGTQQARIAESRRRADLTAQLSHDLRTPLANLRLYAGLIERKAGDAAAVREYCAIVEAEIGRLSRLAAITITCAAGEVREGADTGEAVPDDILGDTVARLRPLLNAAGCAASIHGRAAVLCRFDIAAFERIVGNLIDNARKYAPGGPIEIATRIEGDRLVLSVRDHGPGLTTTRHGRTEGFGLGLATVRRLARAHGGDVRVEDVGPGARFTVWLRVSCIAEVPACAS
jgi:signal transduction histidine kinase